MAKKKAPSEILKLAMTLSILAALPISVLAFNTFRYGFPQAKNTGGIIAPSGQHYNLDIIGVPKGTQATMDENSGYRIFVPLENRVQINLAEGEFKVFDANGTDGRARFHLPNPDPDNDGATDYVVWAKALGKQGDSVLNHCIQDNVSGDTYCSMMQMITVREKGKSEFTDVTRDLLFVYVDLNGDGKAERYSLFSENLQGYYWEYDNKGQKLAQLRFFELPSTSEIE